MSIDRLLWLDLEFTGLNPRVHRIVEVAAVVTDVDLKPIETYEAVVRQSAKDLEASEEVPIEMHKASGLWQQIPDGEDEAVVERSLLDLIDRHWPKDQQPILAGNSIHMDRRMLVEWMPNLDARLHYRMLDVSTIKIIWQMSGKYPFTKKESHRALEDINESIAELKFYAKDTPWLL